MELNESFYKGLVDELSEGVYFVNKDRVVTYWNRGAENITGYASDEVIGSRCADNILMHTDGEGRELCEDACPLAASMRDGRSRTIEAYSHHKDGHRIPVLIRTAPIRVGQEIVGGVETFADNSPKVQFQHRIKELEDLVLLDALTSLPNRRFIEFSLQERLSSLQRYAMQFGVMMMDIDHFKAVNDRFGHLVRDRVLTAVSRTLTANVRGPDFVGRWGGEEFVGILPYAGRDQLATVAARLCHLVEKSTLQLGETTISVTVSIGATEARPEDTPETLIARADGLLLASKEAGRNRATVG